MKLQGIPEAPDYASTENLFMSFLLQVSKRPNKMRTTGIFRLLSVLLRRSCRFILLFCLVIAILATDINLHGLDPHKRITQYAINTWTTDQGLPLDWITALLQTRDGYLWIGTNSGLSRFDGRHFDVFKESETGSIPNDRITSLAEDSSGVLWIATPGGLTRYYGNRFHTFTVHDGLPENSISRISADPEGGIWIITAYGKLLHFDGHQFQHFELPISGHFGETTSLVEDSNHTLWIATFHGLYAFRKNTAVRRYSTTDGLPAETIYAVCLDRDGTLWTAGSNGLSHWNGRRFVPKPIRNLTIATFLQIDRDGNLWTGATGSGLFRINGSDVSRLTSAQGLTSDELYTVMEGRNGDLWIGAVSGLNQLRNGIFTSFGKTEGIPATSWSMNAFGDTDHSIWFGIDQKIIKIADNNIKVLSPGSNRTLITTIYQSAVPAKEGLPSMSRDGEIFITRGKTSFSLGHIPLYGVEFLFHDRSGILWAGSTDEGILVYQNGKKLRSYTNRDGLPDNHVKVIRQDRYGDLWIGTTTGLARLHNGKLNKVVSCEVVTSVIEGSDGSIWAGSESGLVHYKNNQVRIFTQRDGLPTNDIEGLTEDEDGNLWLGTLQGVIRLDKNFLFARDAEEKSHYFLPALFGKSDGLRSSEVRQNSIFRARDGHIWLMTAKEIASISPRHLYVDTPPSIYIKSANLDDAPVDPTSILTVPPGHHRIEFGYSAPDFNTQDRIHFRYKLEGWDRNWVEDGNRRQISYTGIPAGWYRFRVMVANEYGVWNPKEASLSVEVKAFFYQTTWFLSSCAVLLGFLFWTILRFRTAQVAAQVHYRIQGRVEERTRIARDLHDTLLQGILGVSMQIYTAVKHLPFDSPATPILNRVVDRLHTVIEEGRKTLRDLRSSSPSYGTLDESLSLILKGLEIPSNTHLQIVTSGPSLPINSRVQEETFQIVREAVLNTIQHAKASQIQIEIAYSKKKMNLKVTDDGCGITGPAVKIDHWGITGMIERARHIGGQLKVHSRPGKGTTIELCIPGKVAYSQNIMTDTDKSSFRTDRLPSLLKMIKFFRKQHEARDKRDADV